MSSSVSGVGGTETMYRKHCKQLATAQRGNLASGCSAYLETLLVLLLLLVNYTKPEVDFVGLFEVRLHAHDLRKRFLGMLKRPVAVIEDANSIPKFWFLVNVSAMKFHEIVLATFGSLRWYRACWYAE